MTQEEQDREDALAESKKEQRAAPKMLAVLKTLRIKILDSFEEGMAAVVSEEGKALLARMPESGEEVGGELISWSADALPALAELLPPEEPCYVILRPQEKRVVVITWLPENSKVKQ